MLRFEGHVVIVTGAASGIGLGVARAFHDAGASVVLSDLRQEALDQAQATFTDQERLTNVPADVRDAGSISELVTRTEDVFGPTTIMIANAGIVPNASVLTMDLATWDAVIDTNLTGVFLSCQAAARSMVANEIPGRIITVGSIAAEFGRLGASGYCASKAGVVMFTKVLAMELAQNRITVNCVSPGVIDSRPPSVQSDPSASPSRMSSGFMTSVMEAIPLGRRGTVAEVASAVLYLCSPETEYITGAVLSVDGGGSTGWTHMPYSSPRQ